MAESQESQQSQQSQTSEQSESAESSFREKLSRAVAAQVESKAKEAVEKAREKWEADAKLTADQLKEKQRKELEESLRSRAAELDKRERLASAKDMLATKSLPSNLATMLVGKDDEETKTNIESYQAIVEQGIKNGIHARTQSTQTTQTGSTAGGKSPVDKPKSKMNYDEMAALLEAQNKL